MIFILSLYNYCHITLKVFTSPSSVFFFSDYKLFYEVNVLFGYSYISYYIMLTTCFLCKHLHKIVTFIYLKKMLFFYDVIFVFDFTIFHSFTTVEYWPINVSIRTLEYKLTSDAEFTQP